MCCLGPETHNRGIITVSSMLREAGVEVVYLGNASPEEAVRAAMEEDVQVVGVSSLSGAHLCLGKALMDLARKHGMERQVTFLMGGVIPPKDIPVLKEMGFGEIYPSGSTREEIVGCIRKAAQCQCEQ
ncbi:methylmalonyl-CoA mutase [Desulfotomaculum copahuensis]|uniref:Methylmalonyl-CoA mutase n=2 Tax=Desulfotomaculum copahuensis TaxID=1838280 RepID=A0A1B7LB12_9FIRM|nr:methylmalonyl-CoA mutase [Desulfotomaculum copahuensis]